MSKLIKSSLMMSVATAVYVGLVALFMTNGEKLVGNDKTIWGPIVILLLLVLSAAVTGSLVLGKPVMMYIDGKKKEAIKHFALTLGWLFIILVLVLVVLALRK